MDKFTIIEGVAAPMPLINIDTDMIIPKQFLKTIKRSGLGQNLFDEMRFNEDGTEIPSFVLNKESYRSSKIIVAGDNFGCGSSREHAPWALLDFGIKVVISTSFADIFYNNCFKNGILPVVVSPEERDTLMGDAEKGSNARMSVDLEAHCTTLILRQAQLWNATVGWRPYRHGVMRISAVSCEWRRHTVRTVVLVLQNIIKNYTS